MLPSHGNPKDMIATYNNCHKLKRGHHCVVKVCRQGNKNRMSYKQVTFIFTFNYYPSTSLTPSHPQTYQQAKQKWTYSKTAHDNSPKIQRLGMQHVRHLPSLDSKNFLTHLLIDHNKEDWARAPFHLAVWGYGLCTYNRIWWNGHTKQLWTIPSLSSSSQRAFTKCLLCVEGHVRFHLPRKKRLQPQPPSAQAWKMKQVILKYAGIPYQDKERRRSSTG